MGAGALGCLFGYFIQKAGYNVVFVARGRQYKALKNKLKVSGLINDEIKVNVKDKPEDADITFVTVKAYDTENVAKLLRKINCGIVCSLQNGIGNEEILQRYLKNVLGGVTTYASNLIEYGHIEFAGEGVTYIGSLDGEITEDVLTVVEVLKSSKINAEIVNNIREKIWLKAVINSVINPITALCKVRNGKIIDIPELWKIAEELAKEGENIMKALGFNVKNLIEEVKEVILATRNNKSSMLQDIERGKRTEIDFINGAIVKVAEQLGINVPYNRMMWLLIKGVEKIEND
ncbi:MAG TPA: 2-dehydropantoate 2-reductase [Archaeoglobus profundus]|nr:2-dehydropantoate 2-reductase [Archaeoglobus profundus]